MIRLRPDQRNGRKQPADNRRRRKRPPGAKLAFKISLLQYKNYLQKEQNYKNNSEKLKNCNQLISQKGGMIIYRKPICLNFVFSILYPLLLLSFKLPTETSALNSIIASQQSKHSGQFEISQLCAGKSQFPVIKRVEGAVLSSIGDSDVNCSITFRTKSSHQHFAVRFEQLKLGCDDHLRLVDADVDYSPFTIKDFSCKDSLANVPIIKTTGTYLTLRFTTDSRTHETDGFRFVITALFDTNSDCPADYSYCQNHRCISKYLFCDEINHCIDGSDEGPDCTARFGTSSLDAGGGGSFPFNSRESGGLSGGSQGLLSLNLTGALVLLGFIIFIIVVVTLIVLWCINCRAEQGAYAQYQHHLQRTIGVPLQSSASLMFTGNNQQHLQYQYFQPQLSPFVTPQHQATLPRGYSTLPLNQSARQQNSATVNNQQQQANQLPEVHQTGEYLMMTGLTPAQAMQAAPTMQTNLFLPNSHSIMATGIRYPVSAPTPLPRPLQQQQHHQQQQQLQADHKR